MLTPVQVTQAGDDMHRLISDLYPICRSITGEGVRATLRRLQEEIRLEVTEVPSGVQVFDWTVPQEWNIRDAYIKDSQGNRIVDFQKSNLHVLNYSIPIQATFSLEQLKPHLYTLPEHPDWIPYHTSYYEENWGFCLAHNQYLSLADDSYEVSIDSTLEDGSLTYGEYVLPGRTEEEVLISCHVCHPSLCNDNLSGIAVAVSLAKYLESRDLRYTYRFLFIPASIGAITWLAKNFRDLKKIRHGLVLSCLGDASGFTYKRSRRGTAEIDRAMELALRFHGSAYQIEDFAPYGFDERQFCSPGLNLPVGCFSRSMYDRVPEYHTSADNLDFVKSHQLAGALSLCTAVFDILENNKTYCNQKPYGEPQLGKRGLYRSIGGDNIEDENLARLWVLNLSDGEHALLDIAERAGLSFGAVRNAAQALSNKDLLVERNDIANDGLNKEAILSYHDFFRAV